MQDVPIWAMPAHQRFEVRDAGGIAHASRSIRAIAVVQGFSPARIAHLSTVVAECSADLLRYANGGELLVCPLSGSAGSHPGSGGGAGIEILSIGDRLHPSGPTPHSLSAGDLAFAPEIGMTATRQHADEFDCWGLSAAGTVLRVVMWSDKPDHDLAKASSGPDVGLVEYGAISVAPRDQPVCGDAWTCAHSTDGFTVMLADGLGHGLLAHSAAVAAIGSLAPNNGAALPKLVSDAHHALRTTVGAALGVARLPPPDGLSASDRLGCGSDPRGAGSSHDRIARFCGIGNVAASVWEPGRHHHLVSHAGVVGRSIRKTQEFHAAWSRDALLVMHSDGLNTRWELSRYPGLSMRHPSLIAAVLYRDHARGDDDVTVLVARERRPPT